MESEGACTAKVPARSAELRARPPARKVWRSAIAVVLAAIMWVGLFRFPNKPPVPEADSSWRQCLGYFLKNHAQAGIDYVFTYGPLGYFATDVYDPDLFWPAYAWQLVVKLSLVLTFLRLSSFLPNTFARIALLISPIFFLQPGLPEAVYCVFLLALGVALVHEKNCSWRVLAAGIFLIAVISLVKFTYLFLGLLVLAFMEFSWRLRRPRTVLSPLVLYVIFWMGQWVSLGQSISHIPAFVRAGLRISAGYNEAMGISTRGEGPLALLALFVMAAFTAAVIILCLREGRRAEPMAFAGLLEINLFLAWKYGFTRADFAHVIQFFVIALFLAGFATVYFRDGRRGLACKTSLVGLCILINLAGLIQRHGPAGIFSFWLTRWGNNLATAIAPANARKRLEAERQALEREWALPAIRARVGVAPVDLISFEQGLVFLNHLNYRPRPVFQSYSAYIPSLIDANARFFHDDRVPAYVILKIESLDERLPALDDCQALLEVFRRYRPVLTERGYLLLQRCPAEDAGTAPEDVIVRKTVRFGEEVALGEMPEPFRVVSLDFRDSWWGVVRKLLYKPPETFLKARMVSGDTLTYRMIASMAVNGFLLDPLVEDNMDVWGLYRSIAAKRVVSFSVTTDSPAAFGEEIEVTIKGLSPQAWCRPSR
jgi:hypothetical protein